MTEPARLPDTDRRDRILSAAERAFVRHGFHATTMQHVAAEAGMSPGNLYRYFANKDAIVAGLCARDQDALAADFAGLAEAGDITEALGEVLRRQLLDEPEERFRLALEIWAEATRNPAVAAQCAACEAAVREGLAQVIDRARQRGAAAKDIDTGFAVRAMLTIGIGLYKRRAHGFGFDAAAELDMALALIGAVCRGEVRP